MKKFEFKLDAVHKVREIRKDRESNALSAVQAETRAVSEHLSVIEATRRTATDKMTEKIRGGEALNPAELEIQAAYLTSLARRSSDTRRELEAKQAEVMRQIDSVTAALRDVKVTEKLRETQEQRHGVDVSRFEQSAVDELVTTTYSRKLGQHK